MKIIQDKKEFFKESESIIENKILLNICDKNKYGLTDSNEFYKSYYKQPEIDFINKKNKHLGSVFYSKIFSYHIICNILCVELPKTPYNIVPFKYNIFEICCQKLKNYCDSNNIHFLVTPVFGKNILEGNWKVIMSILSNYFQDCKLLIYK